MIRFRSAFPVALLLILAACTPTADTSTPAEPTAIPHPTPSATTGATPSPEETEPAEETPSSTPIEGEGGFTIAANAEADALMVDRFDCQNLDDGYQVEFPAAWNTNAEIGGTPTCSWFAPTEYETGAPGDVPDEVAIEMFVIDDDRVHDGDERDRVEGFIGATQPAYRVVVSDGDETAYLYVIQLGPTLAEGPNLVARTTSEMGGDFDLNRAVLDRMMATMEFIGIIQ